MAAVKYVASVAVVVALAAVTATADVVAVSAVANDLYNIITSYLLRTSYIPFL